MKRRIAASSSMSEGDAPARRSEAERWLGVAAEDSRVARACLDIDPPALGIAAYLCQQAAEKILKGMLIVAEVEFTLTHDLERLTALAEPHYPDVRRLFDEVRSLTPGTPHTGIRDRTPFPSRCRRQPRSTRFLQRLNGLLHGCAFS